MVQVIGSCRQAITYYPSQCWPRSISPYGVTMSKWTWHTQLPSMKWKWHFRTINIDLKPLQWPHLRKHSTTFWSRTYRVNILQISHNSHPIPPSWKLSMAWRFSSTSALLHSMGLLPDTKLQLAHAPGIPGMFYPPTSKETASYRSRHALRHMRDARAVMHVSIPNRRWLGKRSRHSRRIHNPKFYASGKRPILRFIYLGYDGAGLNVL